MVDLVEESAAFRAEDIAFIEFHPAEKGFNFPYRLLVVVAGDMCELPEVLIGEDEVGSDIYAKCEV